MVGIFDVAAGGESLGDAADADVAALELGDEVEGGGFAFYTAVEGEDDFFDGLFVEALEEGVDVELVGADAVHWADDAT